MADEKSPVWNVSSKLRSNARALRKNSTAAERWLWSELRDHRLNGMAFRGQVVEGAGLGAKRLMGTIGDRATLGTLVKPDDWNQYTVIARSGTFIHIVNGQLMAVMIDDDPESSNNQPGIFGIEIEATTKVSVRNIWLRKLN